MTENVDLANKSICISSIYNEPYPETDNRTVDIVHD